MFISPIGLMADYRIRAAKRGLQDLSYRFSLPYPLACRTGDNATGILKNKSNGPGDMQDQP
jgi:hypothetical protein